MELSWSDVVYLVIAFLSPTLLLLLMSRRRHGLWLPPGPPAWPVFGNMFDLGAMPHKSLAELRDIYGDVLWLRLGAINTMAVLSAKAAAELFKKNDMSFVDRSVSETVRSHGYHESSLALAPHGSYWRLLRRLLTVKMMVGKRINDAAVMRRKCIDDMLTWIEEEAREGSDGGGIPVGRFVFLMSFNHIGNLMLSRDLVDPDKEEASEFFAAMAGVMEWSGRPNVADFFPWLRWLDLQGLRRKMDRDMGKALEIASKFVKERIKERKLGNGLVVEERKDFLDVLLEFEGNGKDEPAKFSDHQIFIFILGSRFGTDIGVIFWDQGQGRALVSRLGMGFRIGGRVSGSGSGFVIGVVFGFRDRGGAQDSRLWLGSSFGAGVSDHGPESQS
ncbi:hypothetical protein TIFTF001_008551 [Ficus carica]|uniref:Cytochrome P450 n=1 Tax=Ficus carica TaxID=3494 RepID=A0AA87ZV34_FICCA|nr:hypothetical protein TIFTF001_008551 [Ficus carica]